MKPVGVSAAVGVVFGVAAGADLTSGGTATSTGLQSYFRDLFASKARLPSRMKTMRLSTEPIRLVFLSIVTETKLLDESMEPAVCEPFSPPSECGFPVTT